MSVLLSPDQSQHLFVTKEYPTKVKEIFLNQIKAYKALWTSSILYINNRAVLYCTSVRILPLIKRCYRNKLLLSTGTYHI